eukprot:gene13158-27833_t
MCYYHTITTCKNEPSCKFKHPEICSYLGTCKAGIKCQFKHPQNAPSPGVVPDCFFKARYGKCTMLNCKYNHECSMANKCKNCLKGKRCKFSLETHHSDIKISPDVRGSETSSADGAGHGKSTFINSVHSYFNKKTLYEMEAVIPTKHLQSIEDSPCGTENLNPMNSTDSVTQGCTEYTFLKPFSRNTSITFIDTPGLTDGTRCSAQDKISMDKNLQHISESEHDEPITGIIMIMKGDQNKDISSMQTMAQKLKSIMTQNIIDNIVTVFTNCRFKSICRAHSHIPFNIKENNSFYIDNLVFSVDVAAGLDLNRKKRAYEESWNETMDEIGFILNTIFYQELKNINNDDYNNNSNSHTTSTNRFFRRAEYKGYDNNNIKFKTLRKGHTTSSFPSIFSRKTAETGTGAITTAKSMNNQKTAQTVYPSSPSFSLPNKTVKKDLKKKMFLEILLQGC